MKTVVYQSYRTENVPGWIAACMESVQAWAAASGFDYRFMDDSFLDLAPAWFRERCAGEICPVTDLARLVMARDLLAEGYERTVWVDADVLVFAPELMNVDTPTGCAFCFELWPWLDANGQLQCERKVNNSISVFTRGNHQLEFLIDACQRIASSKSHVDKLALGTTLLTGLAWLMPLRVLDNIGMFSPLLIQGIASGQEQWTAAYAAQLSNPLAAANMCNSLVGLHVHGHTATEAACEAVVETCLRTRGQVVNRHIRKQEGMRA